MITYATPDDPPFLIVHGDRDPLVPHGQSVLLEAALRVAGVEVTLHTVRGAGHGNGFGAEEARRVEAFFRERLRP